MSTPKNILLIGATRGIGFGLVQHALASFPSATLYTTARNPERASELQKLKASNESRVKIFAADSTDPESVNNLAAEVAKSTDTLDLVIYNAGVLVGFGNVLDVGVSGLKDNIETNVYGAYYAAVAFAPFLLRSNFERKSLAFVTSSFGSFALSDTLSAMKAAAFGTVTFDPTAMYNVSKATLNRLGKELDLVLRPQGLPVVLIHPGLVKTEMNPMGDIDVDTSAAGILHVLDKYSATNKQIYLAWNGEDLPW
ncbi:hypothetical protein V1525DRAFT_409743 [Lipomyces kononenkoae]|uniref:Uncharacterized protein n=1 Tax=Lipomyces kononenkoae TaxID=34357 RepID=A0ACC3SV60_LIPKO